MAKQNDSMDGRSPLVTIGIPTVDRFEYLREAVASARAQDYPNLEILISRDYSELTSGHLISLWIKEQQSRDKRVIYIESQTRQGLAGNWNVIVRVARGSFLMIIGDDDRLLPNCVSTLVNAALLLRADVTFANHWVVDGGGKRLDMETRALGLSYGRTHLQPGLQEPHLLVWGNAVPMTSALIAKSKLLVTPFKDDINTPELEVFARMANTQCRFAFVTEFLSEYRMHAKSETAAGLTMDKLFWHLHAIPVPLAAKRAKNKLMKGLVVAALATELRQGELERARAMVRTEYLTATDVMKSMKLAVLSLCAHLPRSAALRIVRWLSPE